MRKWNGCVAFAAVIVGVALSASADVRLPKLFTDHMVLQRNTAIPVWGWAAPGETVTVTLAKGRAKAVAGADGKWKVSLPAMKAGGPYVLTAQGANTIRVSDVLIGEVWVCSGQSNMEMPIDWGIFGKWGSPELTKKMAETDTPTVRMFMVKRNGSAKPLDDVEGDWRLCRHQQILKWSAVGFFFGLELHRELNVPIGLIKTAVGGTRIESWTRRETLEPISKKLADSIAWWDRKAAAFDPAVYAKAVEAWKAEVAKAKAAGKRGPRKPLRMHPDNFRRPAGLYNAMVAPLVDYAIRGVIWYQGESNAGQADQYHPIFDAMIRDWRSQWGRGDFPFLFVQLANFGQRLDAPSTHGWALLREAQLKTLATPNTAMAVAVDIGEAKDIHPKNKLDVGKRLALGAMKLAYGRENIVYSGPIFKAMTVKDGAARLTFDHVGSGLKGKGDALKGFAVAGADKKFVWADARIEGDAVIVSSPEVPAPVAVRYGWAMNPLTSLYNVEGLPASPFRTDNW